MSDDVRLDQTTQILVSPVQRHRTVETQRDTDLYKIIISLKTERCDRYKVIVLSSVMLAGVLKDIWAVLFEQTGLYMSEFYLDPRHEGIVSLRFLDFCL